MEFPKQGSDTAEEWGLILASRGSNGLYFFALVVKTPVNIIRKLPMMMAIAKPPAIKSSEAVFSIGRLIFR